MSFTTAMNVPAVVMQYSWMEKEGFPSPCQAQDQCTSTKYKSPREPKGPELDQVTVQLSFTSGAKALEELFVGAFQVERVNSTAPSSENIL